MKRKGFTPRQAARGRRQEPTSARRALSMVESTAAIVIVGVMLVAAINTLGFSRLTQAQAADRARGRAFAQDLMAEILRQAYDDPEASTNPANLLDLTADLRVLNSLGPEPGEADGTRSRFDDVDDYAGWNASPPQDKSGTKLPDLVGWRRQVQVVWVDATNLTSALLTAAATKRVTVTVEHDDAIVAELVALRTVGLEEAEPGAAILLVVSDATILSPQAIARLTLLESWGFSVTPIAASETQAQFDAAVATADVAYVTPAVLDTQLGTKLREAACGVVNEAITLVDDFGFSSSIRTTNEKSISVVNVLHEITSGFSLGTLTTFSGNQPVFGMNGLTPLDMVPLALTRTSGLTYHPSLATRDVGQLLYGGGTAAGRRVQLPWGQSSFDINALTADGQTILRRALEWAAAGS